MEFDNFVFYGTWRESLEGFKEDFGEEYAKEVLWNIMLAATAGDIETNKKSILGFISGSVMPNINCAKDRYKAAVENGKKGGRPKVELNEKEVMEKKKQLGTWKNVAKEYGISEQTLKNKRNEWENEKNPKNLDIDIDKDIDIDNDKDIDMIANHFTFGTAKQSIKDLLKSGKSLEWVKAAIDKKGYDYFNNSSFQSLGLLFNKSYQAEVDEIFKVKEHNKVAAAKLKQKFDNLQKEEPIVVNIAQQSQNKQFYNLDNLFNESIAN